MLSHRRGTNFEAYWYASSVLLTMFFRGFPGHHRGESCGVLLVLWVREGLEGLLSATVTTMRFGSPAAMIGCWNMYGTKWVDRGDEESHKPSKHHHTLKGSTRWEATVVQEPCNDVGFVTLT